MATEEESVFWGLLAKYKNVIFFNGHSHYTYAMQKYNRNLNIYDFGGTTATMIHVPSVTGPRVIVSDDATSCKTRNGAMSEGGLMLVYDGYEIMNGIDLWNGEILSYACYIRCDKQKDGEPPVVRESKDGKIAWPTTRRRSRRASPARGS